jgi:peptidoglycan/LPS O-acetylase OafA/YrhL
MTQDEKVRLSYRPSLDGIRGVAVLMVMAHHAGLARGGFLGVDAFFVLSGYLITALLMQEWERTGTVRGSGAEPGSAIRSNSVPRQAEVP